MNKRSKKWIKERINGHYHVKYSVILGFPALRKAVKNTSEKIRYFFFTILNRKSFFGIFPDCSFKKIMKNPYRLPTVTFLEGEENQNTKRKTESYVFSGFDNGISRGWERQSTTGRFAAGLFWPCTWKISTVGKDQLNNWEFWAHLKTWVESPQKQTHVFTFQCANALYDFYSGLWILSFSFIIKVDFFCQ